MRIVLDVSEKDISHLLIRFSWAEQMLLGNIFALCYLPALSLRKVYSNDEKNAMDKCSIHNGFNHFHDD